AFEVARRAGDRTRQRIALEAWERTRRDEFRGKWRVERLIGTAVGLPGLFNHAARSLARQRDMADLLVGVAGDFVPPARVLRPGFFLRLLVPRSTPSAPSSDAQVSSHTA
ncbi:MAG: hypothetical protein H7066_06390, partial [Cytophagaceae bacterium]|nr:hypothetical protein [Gemmatimonadaceae bacterium]